MSDADNLKKWQMIVETYSTLHAKDTVQLEDPVPEEEVVPPNNVSLDAALLKQLMDFACSGNCDDEKVQKIVDRCVALNKQVEHIAAEHFDQLTAALEPTEPEYTEAPIDVEDSDEDR